MLFCEDLTIFYQHCVGSCWKPVLDCPWCGYSVGGVFTGMELKICCFEDMFVVFFLRLLYLSTRVLFNFDFRFRIVTILGLLPWFIGSYGLH